MLSNIQVSRLALYRALFFSADTLLILILLSLLAAWLATAIGTMSPHLAFFFFHFHERFMYVTPILGALWLYNRFRSKRFDSDRHIHLRLPFIDSRLLSSATIALALIASFLVAIDNSILAGAGLFAGVMVASGSGAALKHRLIGNVHDRMQLLTAVTSAIALLGGSWLASWAYIGLHGTTIPGGYIAPVLGALSGLFLPLEPSDTPILSSDNAP